MNNIKIFTIALIFTFLYCGCKKNESESALLGQPVFTFTYKGANLSGIDPLSGYQMATVVKGREGTPVINIKMIDVFGGRICFEKTGYAYYADEYAQVDFNSDWQLVDHSSGEAKPVDSVKVYTYRSGALNLSFSDCARVDVTDYNWLTGKKSSHKETRCAVFGTFDLTLVNKNNDTIQLTNGIVNYYNIRY